MSTQVILIVAMAFLLWQALYLIGANLYEMHHALINRRYQRLQNTRLLRQRPLVSICIRSQSERESLLSTLDSVRTCSYRNIEVIIATDSTTFGMVSQTVEQYRMRYPHFCTRIVKKSALATADQTATQQCRGMYVLQIKAGMTLARHSVRNGVWNFALNTGLRQQAIPVRSIFGYQLVPALRNIVLAYSQLMQKSRELFVLSSRTTAPSLYRKEYLLSGSDTLSTKLVRGIEITLGVTSLLAFAYILTSAIENQMYVPLYSACLVVGLILVYAVTSTQARSFIETMCLVLLVLPIAPLILGYVFISWLLLPLGRIKFFSRDVYAAIGR